MQTEHRHRGYPVWVWVWVLPFVVFASGTQSNGSGDPRTRLRNCNKINRTKGTIATRTEEKIKSTWPSLFFFFVFFFRAMKPGWILLIVNWTVARIVKDILTIDAFSVNRQNDGDEVNGRSQRILQLVAKLPGSRADSYGIIKDGF